MRQPKVLKNSNKAWVESWFNWPAFILSLLLLLAPIAAKADPGLQTMIYEVYAGGFHAVDAQLDVDLREKDRYGLSLSAETRGFLGKVAPWEGTFETKGWADGHSARQPEVHKSTTTWKDEPDVKEYLYGEDGDFKGFKLTDKHRKADEMDVDDALTQGTIDALTATLQVMEGITEGKECTGSSEVFDGKRRFELVFKHEGYKDMKSSKYNIFEGTAAECDVEVKPLAGNWHKKPRGWMSIQEQGRERGTMPTVWLATLDDYGPAVPVKIRVKTEYGSLFMHLTKYRNGDGVWVSSRKDD